MQRADIGIHDDFFEAGGNSLLATQMLLEVEAIIGRRLSQSALAEASTIHQLATIAVNEAGDGDELVTKAKDGAGTPFFFCHGDFATRGFYALKLAALLDPDQPVYLIHPVRDPDETTELVIEDMARLYVSRLLELHPRGNFRLGGYCNGGLLAWEIAHQLARFGPAGRRGCTRQRHLAEFAPAISYSPSFRTWRVHALGKDFFKVALETRRDEGSLGLGATIAGQPNWMDCATIPVGA